MQGETDIDIFCIVVFFWDMYATKKSHGISLLKGYGEDSVHFNRK